MSHPAAAVLESALRARKLDRTLTTALQPGKGDGLVAPTGAAALDAVLHGGLPRGELSEVAGAPSSGRTTLLLQVMAAATHRGEIAALVDTFDRLDLASIVAAGIDLDRLLWIRGYDISHGRPQGSGLRAQGGLRHQAWSSPEPRGLGPEAFVDRVIERALKALGLVLQSSGFGVAAIDLADAPSSALNRLPFTTWMRVQRTIEGSETACLIVGSHPIARSAGGVTLSLGGASRWAGDADRSRRIAGLDVTVRVVSPRRRVEGEAAVAAEFA
jgi:recombination protein RecA